MESVKVIGTENGVLILATENGDRFTLTIDDALRSELRRSSREPETLASRPSPRDIQTQIRAGLSAVEVAELLGARVEDVRRFEGPVLAEREHVLSQALSVPVLVHAELEPDAEATFGAAVRAKLVDAGATAERWTSWKDSSGWVVKVEFRAGEVDRDARWSFDPRRSTLAPLNSDASQLSRQGSLPEGLIPRLRALDPSPAPDERFDSGAFGPRRDAEPAATPADIAPERSGEAVREAATKRAPEVVAAPSPETADLLEALRRRRGQRDVPPAGVVADVDRAPVALFDALEPGYEDPAEAPVEAATAPADEPLDDLEATQLSSNRRKGRSSLPSWDEIVFGARTDE